MRSCEGRKQATPAVQEHKRDKGPVDGTAVLGTTPAPSPPPGVQRGQPACHRSFSQNGALAQRHGDPDEFFSWFAEADGIIPGRPVSRVVTTYNKGGERRLIEFHSTDPVEIIEEPGLPPISGGSDADLPGVPTGRATEGPPKPPGSEAPG